MLIWYCREIQHFELMGSESMGILPILLFLSYPSRRKLFIHSPKNNRLEAASLEGFPGPDEVNH